jgi:hypothetical protein
MKKLFVMFIFVLFAFIGVACGNQTEPTISPLSTQSVLESPLDMPNDDVSVPPFHLDEPLLEGDTEVSGTGPAGVPIIIMDASLSEEIGKGKVASDGTFNVEVNPSLVYPNMIGVMLDETQSSPYTKDEVPCVDRCRDQPLVGLLYDRAPVQR